MAIAGESAGQIALEGIDALSNLGLDLLALQEVDRNQERSGFSHVTANIARTANLPYWLFVPTLIGTPGSTWATAHDEHINRNDNNSQDQSAQPQYGISLLSKYELIDVEVLRFKASRVRLPLLLPNRKIMTISDEPRVGLLATVVTPQGKVHIATGHLSFVPIVNARQLRHLARALKARAHQQPALLLGDLNIPGKLASRIANIQPLVTAKTFPNGNPKIQFDHILGLNISDIDVQQSLATAQSLAMPISDHQLLMVDVEA